MIEKIIQHIGDFRSYQIIIFFYLVDLILSAAFSCILFKGTSNGFTSAYKMEEFFLVVMLAPVLETYLFQHLIIITLEKNIRHKLFILLICGFVFGLIHAYTLGYALKAFVSGALYTLLYYILRSKGVNPITGVAMCHAIYNLTAFFINNYVEQ